MALLSECGIVLTIVIATMTTGLHSAEVDLPMPAPCASRSPRIWTQEAEAEWVAPHAASIA